LDRIYTPSALAELLVGACSVHAPQCVADFAAGDGALLRAAGQRWPSATLFGSDLDPDAIEKLDQIDRCATARCDFLDDADRNSLPLLARKCDVVLLNPPFTCRGNARFKVDLNRESYVGSRALIFVATALHYLSDDGRLLAIVPASCLTSEKDEVLRAALAEKCGLKQIGDVHRAAFDGRAVSVVLVELQRPKSATASSEGQRAKLVSLRAYSAQLMRGSLPRFRAIRSPVGSLPYIHTTDLQAGELAIPPRKVAASTRLVEGPAVLLPRVGQPTADKVVVHRSGTVVLSDCLFAIKTAPTGRVDELRALILEHWGEFERLYSGSCAPYVTVRALSEQLLSLGVVTSVVSDMRDRAEGQTTVTYGEAAFG
jgi:tRNA1(Val) A37 N6-methylase TrmN6